MADDEAVRLLEEALHLLMNGGRPPGGTEAWQDWDQRAERFLREDARRRVLGLLREARCELSPEVMQEMDVEALAGHLRDAHPDDGG